MDEVDKVVPNDQKEALLSLLYPEKKWPEFSIKRFEAHTRAFVKVQDGCNSFCTYCLIPYVRGRSKSRSMDAILKEVSMLVENGYKEIVLTGINIGDYQDPNGQMGLAHLVKACDQIAGLERIRISSIDPDEIDDQLLEAVINGKKTCHSMHVVLQSGSNAILKKMNRKYTKQLFLETIDKCKKASKQFTFTTDVIVGFPFESAYDFNETLEVMEEVQFAKVHAFIYSKRERTRAALYKNQVPRNIASERLKVLMLHAKQHAHALRNQFIGQRHRVLVENERFGHTENFLDCILDKPVKTNTIIDVVVKQNQEHGLYGKVDPN
jgi:threonylcarbamoyladenosine tRNA methylthiotransferase MtaB